MSIKELLDEVKQSYSAATSVVLRYDGRDGDGQLKSVSYMPMAKHGELSYSNVELLYANGYAGGHYSDVYETWADALPELLAAAGLADYDKDDGGEGVVVIDLATYQAQVEHSCYTSLTAAQAPVRLAIDRDPRHVLTVVQPPKSEKFAALTVQELINKLQVCGRQAVVCLCVDEYEYAPIVAVINATKPGQPGDDIGNALLRIDSKSAISRALPPTP